MSDYQVQLTIKNGKLHSLMRERGFESMAELSRACGVGQCTLGHIGNLKMSAYNERGDVRIPVQKLADFFLVGVEDLFPPEMLHATLERNPWEASLSSGEMRALLGGEENYLPDFSDALDTDGTFSKILAVANLWPREEKILHGRFVEEKSLRELATQHGVSCDRMRQIEAHILQKLRKAPVLIRDYSPNGGK